MKKLALVAAIAIIAATVWFLASPLWIDQTVNEALPTRDELIAMPAKLREQTMKAITENMAEIPGKAIQERMVVEAKTTALKQGTFKDADAIHKGSGNALLYQLTDGSYLLRLEDFNVTNGPDLMVYLVKNTGVTEANQVTDGYLNLGDLKGNIGNQNYAIPTGTDITEYNSVVIWCELFGILFSPATLSNQQSKY